MTVQHNFQCTYGTDASTDKSVTRWFTQLKESGNVEKQKSTGRPQVCHASRDPSPKNYGSLQFGT
jgi:hypothetical protein